MRFPLRTESSRFGKVYRVLERGNGDVTSCEMEHKSVCAEAAAIEKRIIETKETLHMHNKKVPMTASSFCVEVDKIMRIVSARFGELFTTLGGGGSVCFSPGEEGDLIFENYRIQVNSSFPGRHALSDLSELCGGERAFALTVFLLTLMTTTQHQAATTTTTRVHHYR